MFSRAARSATPNSLVGGRRSTRAARPSSKRRGRRGGGGDNEEGMRIKINQAPARKWAQVWRTPAAGVKFMLPKWVPLDDTTPEERKKFQKAQQKEQVPTEERDNNVKDKDEDKRDQNKQENQNIKVHSEQNREEATTKSEETKQIQTEAVTPDATTENINEEEESYQPPAKRVKLDIPKEKHINQVGNNTVTATATITNATNNERTAEQQNTNTPEADNNTAAEASQTTGASNQDVSMSEPKEESTDI